MKRFSFFTFAAFAAFVTFSLTSCSDGGGPDDPDDCPVEHIKTISFEPSEGMADCLGGGVALGDITVGGSWAGGDFHNVFWAKSLDFASISDEMGIFDDHLFSTADGEIKFGSYLWSDEEYGDTWAGFVLTANYGRTATTVDYANQFTVWAEKGARSTASCMLGYDAGYMGVYGIPTIDLTVPRNVCHVYLANTALSYPYEPSVVAAADYYYKVKITGSLGGVETAVVECVLVQGANKVSDWVKVDLTPLGRVDRLVFTTQTNDTNSFGGLSPSYFAVDELGFAKNN